jgi:hypothetical protein
MTKNHKSTRKQPKKVPVRTSAENEDYINRIIQGRVKATEKEYLEAVQYNQAKEQAALEQAKYNKMMEEDAIRKSQEKAYINKKAARQMMYDIPGTNYQPRNYTRGVTDYIAQANRPKGYSFNKAGLRMEMVSPGYRDEKSGLLAIPAGTPQKGSMGIVKVQGKLNIGVGSFVPGLLRTPNLDFVFTRENSPFKGDVIMPVGVLKLRRKK